MKLFYCFLIFSLFSVQFCLAQISFKIKAGAARSKLGIGGIDSEERPVTTWYGGVATTFRMGKRFFFQPELLYSKRGTNLQQLYATGNPTLTRRFGYISMPLLLGWHPFKKMSLLLGAEPGYMVWEHKPRNDYYDHTLEDVDRYFNVDVDLGLAYQPLPRWTVEVRGLVGMVWLYEEWGQSRTSSYTTGKYVGHHLMMQFGLSYDLKSK